MNNWLRFSSLKDSQSSRVNYTSIEHTDVKSLLDKLQVGDKVEGTLLLNEQGTPVLKLNSGVSIPVILKESIDIGKFFNFTVTGKEGQKYILQPCGETKKQEENIVSIALKHLNLPDRPEIKAIISQFIDKQLTLKKDAIMEVFQSHKCYDIPSEALVNLKESRYPLDAEFLKTVSHIKNEGIDYFISEFQEVLSTVNQESVLREMVQGLAEGLSHTQFKDCLSNLVSRQILSGKATELIEQYLEKMKDVDSQKYVDRYTIDETSRLFVDSQEKLSVAEFQKFFNIIESTLDASDYRKFAKALVTQYLQVDVKVLGDSKEESEKIIKTEEQLAKIVKILKSSSITEETNAAVQKFEQEIVTTNKCNVEMQYYCFPMLFENKETTGELYFFRPKKDAKQGKEQMLIVIALNLPHLHHIQVHIETHKDEINLILKVEDETMKTKIDDYISLLGTQLREEGYHINNISVQLLKVVELKQQEEVPSNIYHMDIKA